MGEKLPTVYTLGCTLPQELGLIKNPY